MGRQHELAAPYFISVSSFLYPPKISYLVLLLTRTAAAVLGGHAVFWVQNLVLVEIMKGCSSGTLQMLRLVLPRKQRGAEKRDGNDLDVKK